MTTVVARSIRRVVGEATFLLRLPPALKAKLEAWAQEERRSVNAQIVYLLERAAAERPEPGR